MKRYLGTGGGVPVWSVPERHLSAMLAYMQDWPFPQVLQDYVQKVGTMEGGHQAELDGETHPGRSSSDSGAL